MRSDSGAPQINPEVVALLEAAQASCVADMRNTADAEVEIHTAQGKERYPLARLIPVLEPSRNATNFARIMAGGYGTHRYSRPAELW